MNQKGFTNIALVVVIIAIIAVGGYFIFVKKSEPIAQQPTPTPTPISNNQQQPPVAQQTPPKVDETQSWLTFTNKKYNYSFKHPQGSSVGSNQFATGEEEAFRKFSEFMAKFHEVNNELKEKLKLMNNAKSQLDRIYSDKKERRKQEEESFLKSKEEAVNEKIRKRQKLTTEDLLVFQKFGKE